MFPFFLRSIVPLLPTFPHYPFRNKMRKCINIYMHVAYVCVSMRLYIARRIHSNFGFEKDTHPFTNSIYARKREQNFGEKSLQKYYRYYIRMEMERGQIIWIALHHSFIECIYQIRRMLRVWGRALWWISLIIVTMKEANETNRFVQKKPKDES